MRETGVLATEAMIDVLGVQYPFQYSMGRLTPLQSTTATGSFRAGRLSLQSRGPDVGLRFRRGTGISQSLTFKSAHTDWQRRSAWLGLPRVSTFSRMFLSVVLSVTRLVDTSIRRDIIGILMSCRWKWPPIPDTSGAHTSHSIVGFIRP